jgi:hypothetical protein
LLEFYPHRGLDLESRLNHLENWACRAGARGPSVAGRAVSTAGGAVTGLPPAAVTGGGGGALDGDVQGSAGGNRIAALQGTPVVAAPVTGQVLTYDGTSWVASSTVSGALTVTGTVTAQAALVHTGSTLGLLGAAAVARPGSYTLAGSATRVFPADPSVAYTGLATGLAATPYAAVADLNTLRAAVSSLLGVVRQIETDLGAASGFGLLSP